MIDKLTPASRTFYERARMKTTLGLYFMAVCMMFMGFTCQYGGQSAFHGSVVQYLNDINANDDQINAEQALDSGYGFATFCYIVAAIVAFAVSLYMCVPVCGSDTEKRTLNHPHELDSSGNSEPYRSYSSNSQQPPIAVAQPYHGAENSKMGAV